MLAKPLGAEAVRSGVDRRIKENQRVRSAGIREVVVGIIEARYERSRGCEVPTGRRSCRGDARGIDTEFRSVGADPADGRLRVRYAFLRRRMGRRRDAVVRSDAHNALRRESRTFAIK